MTRLGATQREQRRGGTEGVPDAVEVVVGGGGGLPERILAGAVDGHQHRVIKAGGELLALVGRAAVDLDGGELFVPCGDGGFARAVEVEALRPRSCAFCFACSMETKERPTLKVTGFAAGSKGEVGAGADDGRRRLGDGDAA